MSEQAPQGFAVIPRAVLYSSSIPVHAKLVYLVLSSHVGKNDTAWPSHAEIARVAGISPAQVKRMLGQLRSAGLVDWRPRKNPRNPAANMSNEYWLIAGARATPAPPDPSSTRPQLTETPVTSDPGSGGAETPVRVSYERESLNEPSTRTVVRLPANTNALFDRFWAAYPRKVEKAKAMKLFAEKLRKGVDPEIVIAGAERYRRDPNREDEFTKHPTTWLNGGCWEDEPLPPRTNGRPPPVQPRRPEQGLTVALPLASGQR